MLTLIPGADFCCARVMKLASPFESGLNLNEVSKVIAAASAQSKIAAARILYTREAIMCSLWR